LRSDLPLISGIALSAGMETSMMEHAVQRHQVILLFDGLDELAASDRRSVVERIRSLHLDQQKITSVISSRPLEQSLDPFEAQQVLEIKDFSERNAVTLLTQYGNEHIARHAIKFLKQTDSQLFSSPLFLSLLPLLVNEYGELPKREDALIDMAIEALLFRHDAVKDGIYRRKTELPVDEAKSVLGAMSLLMIVQGATSVTRLEFKSLVVRGMKLAGVSQGPENPRRAESIEYDFIELGLMVEHEPGRLGLLHRTFQEHLATLAAWRLNIDAKDFSKLLVNILRAHQSPQFAEKVARGWIKSVPQAEALIEQLTLDLQVATKAEADSLAQIIEGIRSDIPKLSAGNDFVGKLLG
jgi:hypothetical protein